MGVSGRDNRCAADNGVPLQQKELYYITFRRFQPHHPLSSRILPANSPTSPTYSIKVDSIAPLP